MSPLFDVISKGDALAVKGLLYGTRAICGEDGRVQKTVSSGQAPVDCHEIDPETGNTALHVLLMAPSENAFQLSDKRDIALLLMHKGIDMTIKNYAGFTALELAKDQPEKVLGLNGKPYDNMLLKAKEAFDRYYQKPPVSASEQIGSASQPPKFNHNLSGVPALQQVYKQDV